VKRGKEVERDGQGEGRVGRKASVLPLRKRLRGRDKEREKQS
jgi:hypothetical protein